MQLQLDAGAPGRRAYPTDVSDEEWALVAPYLTRRREDAGQRAHPLREVFDARRYVVRGGASWRLLPNDLPPWAAVYQQTQRWVRAGVFEAMVHDLRAVLRLADDRGPHPSAVVLDGAVLQSTPERGHRAGYSGHKRKRGSEVHPAIDTLGHLLALRVTPADVDEGAEVAALAAEVQAVTGGRAELAYVDQGYTGAAAEGAAAAHGIALEVVRLPGAKRGFVLLPRRWGVERSISWMRRFRRLARDCERLPATLAGLHYLAFACVLLARAAKLFDPVHNTV